MAVTRRLKWFAFIAPFLFVDLFGFPTFLTPTTFRAPHQPSKKYILSSRDAVSLKGEVVVVTHAAGRMGRTLLGQLRETLAPSTKFRAVVRSEAEASRLKFDLAGVLIRNGETVPADSSILECIDIIVVDSENTQAAMNRLSDAFDGATRAVLCDAAHSEILSSSENGNQVSIPLDAEKESSNRLLAEIEAASHQSMATLKHVVMRSTMGLACMERCDSDECDVAAEEAIAQMGGRDAMSGKLTCEKKLLETGLPSTILRLAALTDDAGMVPLVFGRDDELLLSATKDKTPLISRADAARLSIEVLMNHPAPCGEVIDCSWSGRYGRASVGSEEATRSASRQNVIADARVVASS